MALTAQHILVIETHPILREGIVAVLAHALVGAFITGVAGFPEAVTFIETHVINLVVTDFRAQGDNMLSFLKQRGTAESPRSMILPSAFECSHANS